MSQFRKEFFISLTVLTSAFIISFYIILGGGGNALAEQPSGLISRWNGNAVSGTAARDTISGNNGGLGGGVSLATGQKGKAFKFDGSTGRIIMGNPNNLNFGTGPFTLEAWFNWDGGGSDVNSIIRKSNYGPRAGSGYWLRIARYNKTIDFSVGATTQSEGQTLITAPISSGTWHHVIATRDSSDKVRLYIDGKSTGTVVRQASKAQSTSGSAFAIGFWPDQESEYFSGLIEEVSVYNQGFGMAEVKSDLETGKSEIVYPVAELGNCKSKESCYAYCEKPENSRACLAFVKKHNLLSPEEIAKWEKFIDIIADGGPGGCRSENQCVTYCQDSVHIVECTDFVAKYNLISPQELAEMQKIAKAVRAGAKLPGNCHGKEECISYCQEPAHAEECVTFLEKAEMISHEDADFVRKAQGKSPGDCARGARTPEDGKKACSAFCAKSENQQVCMDFAVQVGLISADDAKELSGGGSLEDFNACLPHIDPKMLKCFDVLGHDAFEKLKAGEVPEDLKDIKEMVAKMKQVKACMNKGVDESFANLPPDGLACLEKELGPDPLEKIKSGRVSCRDFSGAEERIKTCMMDKQLGQLDQCLNLSCSEVSQCINKLGGGEKRDQHELDPALSAKMDQIKAKVNSCISDQIRACLNKGCDEMMPCINGLQDQAEGNKEGGESNQDPALQQEITAKMTSCMKKSGGEGGGMNIGEKNCTSQGGNWDGQQCDFSQKKSGSLDQTECVKQGGDWNGQCDFSKKGAMGEQGGAECTKQGGNWANGQCDFSQKGVKDFGAAECTKQGGSWESGQCNFSHKGGNMGPSECSSQGGSWTGSQCDFSKKGVPQQSGGQIP